jgi:uracil-DNA glycosylase
MGMQKQRISKNKGFLLSSNDCEDENCPVCRLVQKCKKENREPTHEEVIQAMFESTDPG